MKYKVKRHGTAYAYNVHKQYMDPNNRKNEIGTAKYSVTTQSYKKSQTAKLDTTGKATCGSLTCMKTYQ